MDEQLALLPGYLTAHLQLTLGALGVGVGLSLPLGVLASRVPWLGAPAVGLASIIQTVPSLALLAVMVPLLAAMGLPSIGYLPAFVALVLYSLLPTLRNTVAGLVSLDPAFAEAARGLGMTRWQRLVRVELPLAAPVIIAGVRTSAVWTVGMATLSTPVGATSLGNYIFSGLQTRNFTAVSVGCVAAAGLALTLDGGIRLTARGLARGSRALILLGVAVLAALSAYAARPVLLGSGHAGAQGQGVPIRVGTKTFTEQYILGEILAQQIEHRTGEDTELVTSLGSTVAFDALSRGDLDVYVDYSGTLWTNILGRNGAAQTRAAVTAALGEDLARRYGVEVVGPLGFENTYVLAMPGDEARQRAVTTISDLISIAPSLRFGGDYEFFARPEWRSLVERYGLRVAERRSMDASLMIDGALHGEIDVIAGFSTDGRLATEGFVLLQDDRHAIPPYDALILVRPGFTAQYPRVVAALSALVDQIDGATMAAMNLAVDAGAQTPAAAAQQWLDARRSTMQGSPQSSH